MTRRFPAPWSVRELQQAFRIEDADGEAVASTYFRETKAKRAGAVMTGQAVSSHSARRWQV